MATAIELRFTQAQDGLQSSASLELCQHPLKHEEATLRYLTLQQQAGLAAERSFIPCRLSAPEAHISHTASLHDSEL